MTLYGSGRSIVHVVTRHTLTSQGLTPTALMIVPRMGLSFSVFEKLEAKGERVLSRRPKGGKGQGKETEASWIGTCARFVRRADSTVILL